MNKLGTFAAAGTIIVGLLTALLGTALPAHTAGWQEKVDPWVLAEATQREAAFILFLKEQADTSRAREQPTQLAKAAYVYRQLTAVAERTQPPLLTRLQKMAVPYQSFWVANMILVRGNLGVVEEVAQWPEVDHIFANPSVRLQEPALAASRAPTTVEWNIARVKAPEVWAAGYTGQGAVVAGQDTGYDWDHPALKEQYRGWNGAAADHSYNWHDAIHKNNPNTVAGNPCGFSITVPCDDHGHGTHTMGIMVGDDGGSNQIGMAPGAKWIGCRNMEQGWGTPATYSECFQWFVAPTDSNGQNPDVAMAPHIVNNSWSCPPTEGCTDPTVLQTVVENVRAAGILVVASAGNDGSSCNTINKPVAIYDASFTVGSTTSSDTISSFSSRGPVTVDGSNRLKPDIVAPGSGIRSSYPGSRYLSLSGTSMAAPHVAGLAALLIDIEPSLAGFPGSIEDVIKLSAVAQTTGQGCGSDAPDAVPNNVYGYGRIDALAALKWLVPTAVRLRATAVHSLLPGAVWLVALVASITLLLFWLRRHNF